MWYYYISDPDHELYNSVRLLWTVKFAELIWWQRHGVLLRRPSTLIAAIFVLSIGICGTYVYTDQLNSMIWVSGVAYEVTELGSRSSPVYTCSSSVYTCSSSVYTCSSSVYTCSSSVYTFLPVSHLGTVRSISVLMGNEFFGTDKRKTNYWHVDQNQETESKTSWSGQLDNRSYCTDAILLPSLSLP